MGRCNFYLYGPAVPGAIAPVDATEDMTNPVGIKNCRLYVDAPTAEDMTELNDRVTALENGAVANNDALAFSGNIATMAADTEFIQLSEVYNSNNSKFTISGDSIVIGDGVSLIAVSANAGSVSLGGAVSIGLTLLKNGASVCYMYRALSTNGDTATLPMCVVPVTAGDVIKFSFGAKAGASLIFSYGSVIALA